MDIIEKARKKLPSPTDFEGDTIYIPILEAGPVTEFNVYLNGEPIPGIRRPAIPNPNQHSIAVFIKKINNEVVAWEFVRTQ